MAIDKVRMKRRMTPMLSDMWMNFATGDSGDIQLEREWLRAAQVCYETKMLDAIIDTYEIFCKKQHDYGPLNIAIAGPKGVAVRMVDKFSRLFNLLGIGKHSEDVPANTEEALYDTAMDLADYGIILMLTLDGSWKLASLDEAFSLTPKERHTDGEKQLTLFDTEVE